MTIHPVFLLAFTLLILLNAIVAAARYGFLNAHPDKVRANAAAAEAQPTLLLLADRDLANFSLQASQIMLWALIAGLAGGYASLFAPAPYNILLALPILLALGALIAVGELWIESRVLAEPEAWAARLTRFTRGWLLLLSPALFLPRSIFRAVYRERGKYFRVTEDELNLILDEGERDGVLEGDEREMINSIFEFGDTLTREVMVPRIDLLSLNIETTVQDALDALIQSGYSRVPVYEENADNVVGILYLKDLIRLYREGDPHGSIRSVLRQPYFVPETKKAGDLLAEMQRERMHIALVVDEYGGIAGLVTLEDIVEEIVGEIQDEYDDAEERPVEQIGDDEYLFLGRIEVTEFNEWMGTRLPEDEADTLAGILYNHFGRVPRPGETLATDDILISVEQVAGRRIRKVKATRTTSASRLPETDPHADSRTKERIDPGGQ